MFVILIALALLGIVLYHAVVALEKISADGLKEKVAMHKTLASRCATDQHDLSQISKIL